jgi:hypothetical protein
MAKIQEGENQIIIDYEVYEKRPSDSELMIPAIDAPEKKWAVGPAWWQATRHSTQPRLKLPRMREGSSAYASRITPPKAPSGSANKRSAGSKKDRNGGPSPRPFAREIRGRA